MTQPGTDPQTYAASKGWQTRLHDDQLQVRLCPICNGGDHHDKWTFAMLMATGASNCKRGSCGWAGSFTDLQRRLDGQPSGRGQVVNFYRPVKVAKKFAKPDNHVAERQQAIQANAKLLRYLTTTTDAGIRKNKRGKEVHVVGRGFTAEVVERFRLGLDGEWIAIPYFRDGELVRTKYRTVTKDFKIDAGTEPILYNIDAASGDDIVITEGEFDVIALAVCGVDNAVSVPDGCEDRGWIEHNWDWLASKRTIRLAVDFDEGGHRLEQEIVNRLGRDRCLRVKLPHKDANACIQAGMSPDEVRALVEHAEPYPMSGLLTAIDLYDDLFALYHDDRPMGISTGWSQLDRILGGIRTEEFSVVTGTPGSGKSEWLGALAINLAKAGVRTVIAGMESKPHLVMKNQLCQLTGRPFFGDGRMTWDEVNEQVIWLQERIYHATVSDEDQPWARLCEIFRYAARRYGCKVAIADPLTMLLGGASKDSERFDVDNILRSARRLVAELDIHLFIVAHPRKLVNDRAVADLYDINGSAGVPNLCWNGISIWRDVDAEEQGRNEVVAFVKKNRALGTLGNVRFLFDARSKRYTTVGDKIVKVSPSTTPEPIDWKAANGRLDVAGSEQWWDR